MGPILRNCEQMKKYRVLAASLVVQVCLGGLFAWSTFVNPLMDGYGFTAARTQAVFGITVAVFTVTMIAAGRLEQRLGPAMVAAIGGILFGCGYLLAGFSGGDFVGVLLGIGVLSGAGIAMGYVCPLTTLVKWFPARKGFITGVSVAGFGAGAIVLSQAAGALLRGGADVFTVFKWVGLVYGVAVTSAAMFLDVPDGWRGDVSGNASNVKAVLREGVFLSLLVGMFSGTLAGLVVIGNLMPMGIAAGLDAGTAEMAISVFAVGNAAGRICWGWLADHIGRWAVPTSLAWLGVAVAGLYVADSSAAGFSAAAGCVGFGFGGCFVVYVTRIAVVYGPGTVGTLYPIVFLVYGVAGLIGPVIAGRLYDAWGTYGVAIAIACGVTWLGGVATWILSSKPNAAAQVQP
jgi:OFA family oxalate/formate antiporter-like MFS transporter